MPNFERLSPVKHTKEGDVHSISAKEIRVLVMKDADALFAQGLDIDYAAEGESMDEVIENFVGGLVRTLHEHLVVHGNLRKLPAPAPPEYWQAYLSDDVHHVECRWLSVHKVPCDPEVRPKVGEDRPGLKLSVYSSIPASAVTV